MQIHSTQLDGVVILEPRVFADARGFFLETFHRERFLQARLPAEFPQSNWSRSVQCTLRGLHYQYRRPQGKLVSVLRGEIYDVAVDLRKGSNTFGQWVGVILSDTNHRQLYIPPGLAHGFAVTSEFADVQYACTDLYDPQSEYTILWSDAQLRITWPISDPIVSEKDSRGMRFEDVPKFEIA